MKRNLPTYIGTILLTSLAAFLPSTTYAESRFHKARMDWLSLRKDLVSGKIEDQGTGDAVFRSITLYDECSSDQQIRTRYCQPRFLDLADRIICDDSEKNTLFLNWKEPIKQKFKKNFIDQFQRLKDTPSYNESSEKSQKEYNRISRCIPTEQRIDRSALDEPEALFERKSVIRKIDDLHKQLKSGLETDEEITDAVNDLADYAIWCSDDWKTRRYCTHYTTSLFKSLYLPEFADDPDLKNWDPEMLSKFKENLKLELCPILNSDDLVASKLHYQGAKETLEEICLP